MPSVLLITDFLLSEQEIRDGNQQSEEDHEGTKVRKHGTGTQDAYFVLSRFRDGHDICGSAALWCHEWSIAGVRGRRVC